MKLPLFKSIGRTLRKKAKWKALDPKTRKLSANLLVCSIYSLIAALACAVAIVYEAPQIETIRVLGLAATLAWMALTFLALTSNVAGVVLSRVERYHRVNHAVQKSVKRVLVTRVPTLCVASYRAGNSRAHRSPSRSHASSSSSDDGESDSGEGDPPAPPSLSLLSLKPHLTFTCFYCKPNSFSSPWRSLSGPGCWCLSFCLSLAERGWRL